LASYLAGFIPQAGKSVLDYAGVDKASLLGPVLEFNADQISAELANPVINFPKVFIQDGTDKQQQQFVLDLYRAEPVIPLATPLSTLPKTTLLPEKNTICLRQLIMRLATIQQQMTEDAGITKTFTINSGHSPFISKPSELTSTLENIIKD